MRIEQWLASARLHLVLHSVVQHCVCACMCACAAPGWNCYSELFWREGDESSLYYWCAGWQRQCVHVKFQILPTLLFWRRNIKLGRNKIQCGLVIPIASNLVDLMKHSVRRLTSQSEALTPPSSVCAIWQLLSLSLSLSWQRGGITHCHHYPLECHLLMKAKVLDDKYGWEKNGTCKWSHLVALYLNLLGYFEGTEGPWLWGRGEGCLWLTYNRQWGWATRYKLQPEKDTGFVCLHTAECM